MATLFSKIQPLSLEMLDEKEAITKHLTPSVLSSIESEMKALVDSFRAIAAQKKKMGAFSTREQNKALNEARTKHTQLAPTLKWFLERCVLPLLPFLSFEFYLTPTPTPTPHSQNRRLLLQVLAPRRHERQDARHPQCVRLLQVPLQVLDF